MQQPPVSEPAENPGFAPSSIDRTDWTFQSVGGVAVPGESAANLRFENGRISGNSGCNRFSGIYDLNATAMTVGPVAGTRMACPGPAMDQENRLFTILKGTLGMSFRDNDTLMVLTSETGRTLVLRRAP